MKTEAATRWLQRVGALQCVLCMYLGVRQRTPTMRHHVREGQGLGQRASDFLVVALCAECHQGPSGLHGLGTLGFYRRYKLDELDLLAMTIELVAASTFTKGGTP